MAKRHPNNLRNQVNCRSFYWSIVLWCSTSTSTWAPPSRVLWWVWWASLATRRALKRRGTTVRFHRGLRGSRRAQDQLFHLFRSCDPVDLLEREISNLSAWNKVFFKLNLRHLCLKILSTFSLLYWEANFLCPRGLIMGKRSSSNFKIGWDRGDWVPGAFKLDHL